MDFNRRLRLGAFLLAAFFNTSALVAQPWAAPNLVDKRASYWAEKPSTVIAKTVVAIPAAWRVDQQALVDAELNPRVASGFARHLSGIDIERPLNEGVIRMGGMLRGAGIEVRTYRAPLDLTSLQPFANAREGETTLLDMRPLRSKFQRDYLLLMGITKAGVVRSYGTDGKAAGGPAGYGVAVAELIDLRNNNIVWRYRAAERASGVGKWYQSAEYPVATAAAQQAVKKAVDAVIAKF